MQSLEKTLTVLFVDDDADEFYLFNEALEQSYLPVKMIRAKDGRHLLNLLDSNTSPDIIFMDVNMPHKDGIETLSEIKANNRLRDIPVIIFSTSKNAHQINTCYQKGAHYYVVKPERFDDITKLVKKVFSVDWKTGVLQPSKQDFVLEY
jgi:CheY-like chemotaxis protein